MNEQPRIFRSNMTSKCQVTIPKEIRDALGLKAGDRVIPGPCNTVRNLRDGDPVKVETPDRSTRR